jgi:chromosome segregation ATPase
MTGFAIALDVVVALLLAATIVYASVLNRKLATLRNTKQEMEALVNRLVESTSKAEGALSELKAAANESGQRLETQVMQARELSDDMNFLVEKATSLADRLEGQIGQARAATRPANEGGQTAKGPAKKASEPAAGRKQAASGGSSLAARGSRGDVEDEPPANASLLRALRGVR